AVGIAAIRAASEATRTVPIVVFGVDPVRLGLAQSLSRPGGNVTGIALSGPGGQTEKAMELLHEVVPTARRIAVLTTTVAVGWDSLITLMANRGVAVHVFYADRQEEYPAAFAAMREAG